MYESRVYIIASNTFTSLLTNLSGEIGPKRSWAKLRTNLAGPKFKLP